ncbi:chaperone SurA precursor [bacterium BMS3Bbin09]|nr:chaperone SurA precursor [bacterium BMS3Bbin09]
MKKTITAILIFVTAFLFCPEVQSAVLLDRVVATVNDEVITWSELMNIILLDGRKYISSKDDRSREEKIHELERPFLNMLIEMKLQTQEAKAMGLTVQDDEINSAMSDIRAKYNMTEDAFLASMEKEGITIEDYTKEIGNQILLQKVVNYAVKGSVVVTDKEVEEYFNANRELFNNEKDKFRIRQIFFAAPADDSQRKDIEVKAREIVQRIKNGESFAELANEFSEGPGRRFGGDLGYISSGSALAEIEKAADALETGGLSEPFWSSAGLHIIKLEERVKAGGVEKIRENIREKLFRKAYELKYHEWKTELKEKAYIEIKL